MALIEALTIELGSSIAKSILKRWLKDDIASNASSSIIDVLKSWTTDRTVQQRANRQLEEIGEKVGENLLPIFEIDGANLDDASRTAVALAVAETLNTLSSNILVQHNLEPSELTKYLLEHPIGIEGFNDTEKSLYRSIISESCQYIVDIASQLPTFTEKTFAEIFKREGQLLNIAKQILEEMRQMREQANPIAKSSQFELEYRRAVNRRLDFLQLYGADVSVSSASRRHRLSIAYVALSVEKKALSSKDKINATNSVGEEGKTEIDNNITSVENVLKKSNRLLVYGMAGSGKTTLLQWIAVNAASQTFKQPLEHWNKALPFYISLRSYVNTKLPQPEDFPNYVAPVIVGIMPEGWVHTTLSSKYAIILIDGLDEVPEQQREDVRLWLEDLVETYPQANFTITSRPNALGEDWKIWLERKEFDNAELQSMDLPAINIFIDHWHSAVAEVLSVEQEKLELRTYAQQLKNEIEQSGPKRNLATSPLLCAMLCALNRERKQQLPSDRIELYEACCQMLIERRNTERQVPLNDYPAQILPYRAKRVLLEDFAYWLINNGWTQVEIERADERFMRKLVNMPNASSHISGNDVRRLFVERSNILREPVAGHIDFTHRTFQEFLAAQAAVDDGDIGVLIKNAEDDQWHEVIVLAAGIAARKMREELILGLIKRGDEKKELRYELHLLAIACLDTSIELGQNVASEIEKRLSALIPPRNMTEAKALAAAKDLAVPYLAKSNKWPVTATTACIRALAIIGSDAALKILETYTNDSRSTVVKELINVWNYFDRDVYGQKILSKILKEVSINLAYLPSLRGLQYVNNLQELILQNCEQINDLSLLAKFTQLTSLGLHYFNQVSDLSPLAHLTQLTSLNLRGYQQVSDLSPLAHLTQLTSLSLSQKTFTNVRNKDILEKIEFLEIWEGNEMRQRVWKFKQ